MLKKTKIRGVIKIMGMEFLKKLPTPQELKEQFPANKNIIKIKARRDKEIRDIFEGKVDKLILIIGPCSADNEDMVIDYISRLRKVQERVEDKILIIPRINTNRVRTMLKEYKGVSHQLNTETDMINKIITIRRIHKRAVDETDFTCADEMLYPENHEYLSDLLSYVTIRAQSVENQQHRLTASGINVPVGMKNPTSGDISVMMNSIIAAQHSHTFLYRGWEVKTKGNPLTHAILRGYIDKFGMNIPNYHYEDLYHLIESYGAIYSENEKYFENPAVIVDTNQFRPNTIFEEQIRISKDIIHSCHESKDVHNLVKGLMIESYIEDKNQKLDKQCYGGFITASYIGWEKTEKLIYDLADLW